MPPPNSPTSLLTPAWTAVHPWAYAYDSLMRHACTAVPIHKNNIYLPLHRQIQLICYFDYVKGNSSSSSFGSYLVRVLGSGARMPVDMGLHTWPFSSSSIMYDASFNSVYLTTYQTVSYSGLKHVVKIRLSPSYNYASEVSSTAARGSLQSAMELSNFQLPVIASCASFSQCYPLGISFDSAAIKPLTNHLFFYAPTLDPASQMYMNVLYYIPGDDMHATSYVPSGQRVLSCVAVEGSGSRYARGTLQSISILYGIGEGWIQLLFSLYGGLYARLDSQSSWQSVVSCTQCPAGKTSVRGQAQSLYDCFCEPWTYLSYATGSCEPVTRKCPEGQYISRLHTTTSDIQCLPCPVCPLGYYRDRADCLPDRWRDASLPAKCIPCATCDPGYYLDASKCNPAGIYGSVKSQDCRSCNSICGDMENIVGIPCSGRAIYNTQSCQRCISTCPAGEFCVGSCVIWDTMAHSTLIVRGSSTVKQVMVCFITLL